MAHPGSVAGIVKSSASVSPLASELVNPLTVSPRAVWVRLELRPTGMHAPAGVVMMAPLSYRSWAIAGAAIPTAMPAATRTRVVSFIRYYLRLVNRTERQRRDAQRGYTVRVSRGHRPPK